MDDKEFSNVFAIPANYTDSGKILGGMLEPRNAVEALVLIVLVGYPELKVAVVAGLRRLRQLRRYGVGFGDFLGAVFVTVILSAAAAVPILDVALGILGRRLGREML